MNTKEEKKISLISDTLLSSSIIEYYGEEVINYYKEKESVVEEWLFNFTIDKGEFYLNYYKENSLDKEDINSNKRKYDINVPWKEMSINERLQIFDEYILSNKVKEEEHIKELRGNIKSGKLCTYYIKYSKNNISEIKKKRKDKIRIDNKDLNEVIINTIMKYRKQTINEKITEEIHNNVLKSLGLKLNKGEIEKVNKSIKQIISIQQNCL